MRAMSQGVAAKGKGRMRGLVHRATRSDRSPQVVRKVKALRQPTVCERCGAVYSHKTWRGGERTARTPLVGASWTVCPACQQVRQGEYYGRVEVRGSFAAEHEEEIRRRVRNVEARARFTQPERRVVSVERSGAVLEILTTSQKLAHRVVRELEKTFGGRATLAWSDRDGELRATWEKEEPSAAPRRGGRR